MKGSVHKKGNWWVVSIYWEKKRYWIRKDPTTHERFGTKTHATQVLWAIQEQIKRKEFDPRFWLPDSPMAFKQYAERWLNLKSEEVSRKTYTDYRGYFNNHIIPYFGEKDIRHLRHFDLKEFYKLLKKKVSGKTAYNIMACMRTMIRDAWRNGDIQYGLLPAFPVLSFDEPEIKALTMEEQQRLIEAIPERDRPIFICGMECGLRVQEARAIQKDQIKNGYIIIDRKFSENEFVMTTKTGKKGIREIPISSYLDEVLKSIPRSLSPFVFTRSDGKPYTNKNLNQIWKVACRQTGIFIKLQNAFRHSLGCQLIDQGEDLDTVRDLLGHTNTRTTRRYVKRNLEVKRKALERRHGDIIAFKRNSTE